MLKTTLCLDFIHDLGDGRYRFEGYLSGRDAHLSDVHIVAGNKQYPLLPVDRPLASHGVLRKEVVASIAFEVVITIHKSQKNLINARLGKEKVAIRANRYTGLSSLAMSYKTYGGVVFFLHGGRLKTYPISKVRTVYFEFLYLLSILINWKLGPMYDAVSDPSGSGKKIGRALLKTAEAIFMMPRSMVLRVVYWIALSQKNRLIWIISDRGMAAGDNGEALFRYCMSLKNRPVNIYFALSKKSKDYDRLKAIGPVLNHGSLRYKLKFLLADKIISSHADTEVTNPFLRQIDHFVNLYNFKFVFLQHGIIRNDLSKWLNRFEKNIATFVTSAEPEYDSILKYPYFYQKENVLLLLESTVWRSLHH